MKIGVHLDKYELATIVYEHLRNTSLNDTLRRREVKGVEITLDDSKVEFTFDVMEN